MAVLALAALVGFVAYPTYPNYDSYYSLLWGRELIHLEPLSFEAYRAPTEHPLAIAFGAVLSLFGQDADRLLVALTIASFVVLAAGLYRLARISFTPVVGLLSVALLCTRFDFPFLAARGYIDVPFLAIVVWAAALEAASPRRGTPVLLLLAAAGLMRPEAWVLSGLYFLWCAWHASWRTRALQLALAGVAPVVWAAIDFAVTGDPLFSLHSTSGLAEELGRQKTLSDVPNATWTYLVNLDKLPVVVGGLAGLALATWYSPRRMVLPAAVLGAGIGTFVMVGVAGLSVIDRYLLVPSLMMMVFAAVGLGGWTMLRPGTPVRQLWAAAAVALALYGIVSAAFNVRLSGFTGELEFRGDAHASLERILDHPRVEAGLRCGPLSVPNHKLIPDARWLLGAAESDVIARSDVRAAAQRGDGSLRARIARGVALYATGTAIFRQALTDANDNPLDQVPGQLPGYMRAASDRYYAAYVRC